MENITDNNKSYLIYFYLIKRLFLFFDEWLFYYILYKLYNEHLYIPFVIVLGYGTLCIYTSYKNIDLLENKIVDIEQSIWITKSPFESIKKLINSMNTKRKDIVCN